MKQNKNNSLVPLIGLFLVITAASFVGFPASWGVDKNVMLVGNAILFLTTLLSYLLAVRGLTSKNQHQFTRSVYASIMIKLFVCVIAAFIYIMTFKKEINKPALFACMGLYLVYTFIEVAMLTKVLKQKPNV